MISSPDTAPATLGRVLHWAAGYDLLVWLLTRRSDRAFREQLASFAHLSANESVLDIGCGTGTLAIVAKGRVGATGQVFGIDASPAMIARATAKAAKAGVDVSFKNALAEALPFPEGQFDVVLSTLMLHHLPRKVRRQCAREIRRVLKPQGRALVVDFAHAQPKSGFSRISTAMVTLTRKMLWRCSRKRNCAASRVDRWASAVSTSCGRWRW